MWKKWLLAISIILVALSSVTPDSEDTSADLSAAIFYRSLDPAGFSLPDFQVFRKGLAGYFILKQEKMIKNQKITIIDFSYSSKKKRLWVIDLEKKKVLFHSLVAHGKKTGEEFARSFSNELQSHQSSLGFYVTGDTYYGKHGLSLYLDGVEEGINDNARKRAIVMHGADYVSKDFIEHYGRLGRSFGCPSVPRDLNEKIINGIKDRSCLFIYYPDDTYESVSHLIPGPVI